MGDSLFSFCVKLCTDELDISANFLSSFTSVLSLQARNLGSKVTSEFEKVSKQSSIDQKPCILDPLSERSVEVVFMSIKVGA